MEWLTGLVPLGDSAQTGGLIAALAAAVATIILALRKRQDVDVDELIKRVTSLESRVEELESDLTTTRASLVAADRNTFVLRRTLAQHGIPDPTAEAS